MRVQLSLILLVFFLCVPAHGQPIFKTPAQAAQHLYGSWQKKSKTKARQVTHDEAIEKLFSVRRHRMIFKGCSKREEGDYECLYEDKKTDLTLAMLLESTRRGYIVKSLSFSSEAY